jgi:hypothetical protein
MCDIPRDLERRFERRWAARFSARPKSIALKGSSINGPPRPTKAKEKPADVNRARERADLSPHASWLSPLPCGVADDPLPVMLPGRSAPAHGDEFARQKKRPRR